MLGSIISGAMAGATSLVIVYPLEFVNTRLAADIGNYENREFKGIFDCLIKVKRYEGY